MFPKPISIHFFGYLLILWLRCSTLQHIHMLCLRNLDPLLFSNRKYGLLMPLPVFSKSWVAVIAVLWKETVVVLGLGLWSMLPGAWVVNRLPLGYLDKQFCLFQTESRQFSNRCPQRKHVMIRFTQSKIVQFISHGTISCFRVQNKSNVYFKVCLFFSRISTVSGITSFMTRVELH